MGCCSSVRANKFNVLDNTSNYNHRQQEHMDDLIIEPSAFIHHKTSDIKLDYTFGPKLGTGSYGSVRIAVHKATGQERAIKTLKKSSITASQKQKSKFFSEVDILRSIDHPNIVRLYEFYEDSKYFHLVTEVVKGGELFDYIVSSKILSENIAAFFFRQILSAVNYCHSRGIVHRDLKPENLLLVKKSSSSLLKVIDFGTCTLINNRKTISGKFGTAFYIAPEVIKGEYNEKCDVWSCGVILFILLSGRPPFYGKSEDEIFQKIEKGIYSFKSAEWTLISTEAKIFISRMLELNIDKRISASEALQDPWLLKFLHCVNDGQSIIATTNMQSFYTKSKLQQAVLSFIVTQMNNKEEIQKLSQIFNSIDLDGDGKLSREELMTEYCKSKPPDEAEEAVNRIMKEVDINCSGYIDYSEFLMATLKQETLLSKENLESAFKAFDLDGSGSINFNDLKQALGQEMDSGDSMWQEIINKVDKNNDGIIDLKEFMEMMLNVF